MQERKWAPWFGELGFKGLEGRGRGEEEEEGEGGWEEGEGAALHSPHGSTSSGLAPLSQSYYDSQTRSKP